MTAEEMTRLIARADELRQQRDKASGAFGELKKRLSKEFGVKSLKEAEALLKKEKAKLDRMDRELAEMVKVFEKEYMDKFGKPGMTKEELTTLMDEWDAAAKAGNWKTVGDKYAAVRAAITELGSIVWRGDVWIIDQGRLTIRNPPPEKVAGYIAKQHW